MPPVLRTVILGWQVYWTGPRKPKRGGKPVEVTVAVSRMFSSKASAEQFKKIAERNGKYAGGNYFVSERSGTDGRS